MRNEDPVHCAVHPQTGHTHWFLTRYDDCLNFLKDKRFGKEIRRRLPARISNRRTQGGMDDIINQHMLNLDDPDHARLKAIVHVAFTPPRINALRSRLLVIADGLFDAIDAEIIAGEEFDLTERYIRKLPLMSIAGMIGIPLTDFHILHAWTQDMLLSDQAIARRAVAEFSMYLDRQIEFRRRSPPSSADLLSSLISSEDRGETRSRDERLVMVFLLITAEYESIVTFIGWQAKNKRFCQR